MGFGRYRFRRSFGQVNSQFRGARPSTYPNFQGLLDLYPGAAAAYSLRALSSGWLAGDVVEVRRSSDSTTQDFTASQITNGQMLSFVNNSSWTSAVNSPTSPYTTFTGASLSGFSATLTTGVAFGGFGGVSGVSGQTVSVSFDVVINSGSPNLSLRASSTVINTKSNSVAITTSGSYTADLTANDTFGFIGFSEGDAGSDYTISNFEVTAVSGEDGFVSTWYDQSGNANDATQITTTSQPKIVDAGSLVTGGLDFYNNSFLESASFADGTASSLFMVFNNQAADATRKIFFSKSTFPSDGVIVNYRGDVAAGQYTFVNYDGTTRSLTYSDLTSPQYGLSTSIINGSGKEIFLNGASQASDAESFVGGSSVLRLGSAGFGTGFGLAEAILYQTDETTNRVAIETNINDHYSIY